MVSQNTMNGLCHSCEFYREDRCMRAEKMFSTLSDPICLAKIQCMLLRDIAGMFEEYFFEED
jgi:hypothetical protein